MEFNVIANILLILCTILAGVFTTLYVTRSNWKSTTVGIIHLILNGFLTVYFGFAIVSNLYPDFPGRQLLRIIIYTGVGLFLGWQLWNLLRIQSNSRKECRETADETYISSLHEAVKSKDKK